MKISLLLCALIFLISICNLIAPWPLEFYPKIMPAFAILSIAWLGLEFAPRVCRVLIRDKETRRLVITLLIAFSLIGLMYSAGVLNDKTPDWTITVIVFGLLVGYAIARRCLVLYFRKQAKIENAQNLEKV